MRDRINRILEILENTISIKTSILAELINVSHVTLKKDIDVLERRGIIGISHGYISLDVALNGCNRMGIHHSIKKRIASAAAHTVEDGETVLLESGSCCMLFAEELAVTRKNVTIITNSIFISTHLPGMTTIKVILLGGFLIPEYQITAGSIIAKCSENFYTDKIFIGTNGFVPEYGFTGEDLVRVETISEMAKHAKNVFLLTESAKFFKRGTYNMIKFENVAGIFTDDGIPEEAESELLKNNITLYKVPALDDKSEDKFTHYHQPTDHKYR